MHIYVTSNRQKVETLMFYILRRGWVTANSTLSSLNWQKLSLVVRKQRRRGNREADQRLCFHYMDSKIPLLSKSEISSFNHLLWLYSLVCIGPGRKHRRPVFSQQPQLKLIQASQCLFLWHERVQSKITEKRWRHHFPYSMGIFFTCERAANSVVDGPIWPKFELIQDMHVLVTCKIEKDRINSN